MNERTVAIICLIIIFICFLVMSSCRCGNVAAFEKYTVEENLRFEDSSKFKNCVQKCIQNCSPCGKYIWSCMNSLDCAICMDECYTEYKPDSFLVDRVFDDIDKHYKSCFINNIR